MIPAAFDYVRAGSAAEAISLIGEHGDDAKFLAGGHSLLPLMKLRLASPSVLVDIGRVTDLSYIRDAGDHVAIGALTRHAEVEHSSLLAQHVPLLAHAASHVGDPQVRHRGTIGGSIAHADAASDLPATTLALGATYVAQGPNGTREIAARDFYQGFLESALAPDEMLTEIRVPKMNGAGWSFQKFNRRAQDWAIVGVAAWRRGNESGVALVNMGSTPILATSVSGAIASGASVSDAAQLAAAEAEPQNDLNASPEYRVHLAKVLVRRALEARELNLVNLDNALALSRRFPYLKPVTLARGVFDLKNDLPARDIALVATQRLESQAAQDDLIGVLRDDARLHHAAEMEHFRFYGTVLSGQPAPEPAWQRAAHVIDGTLGEALGNLYVERNFPPAARARAADRLQL